MIVLGIGTLLIAAVVIASVSYIAGYCMGNKKSKKDEAG